MQFSLAFNSLGYSKIENEYIRTFFSIILESEKVEICNLKFQFKFNTTAKIDMNALHVNEMYVNDNLVNMPRA